MSTSAYTRSPVINLAALALAACPFQKEKRHDDPAVYYVNALAGLNTNSGTQISPFKTITYALSVAKRSGSTVHVLPGAYNVANGEVFPITVPAGVLPLREQPHKGGGSNPPNIGGGGGPAPSTHSLAGVALHPLTALPL